MTIPLGLENRCGACLLYGAVEGLADGLVLFDPQERVFHLNRRAEQILGVRAARALGARPEAVLRHALLLAFYDSASDHPDPATAEIALPPGLTIRASLSVCRSAEGAAIGRALLLQDVTRERKVHVELSSALARRLVEMAGGDAAAAPLPDLTRRERQILELLAGGISNAAIAARLRVSPHTVASHLKHLYPKIGVVNRAQAAAYALAHGLRPPPK